MIGEEKVNRDEPVEGKVRREKRQLNIKNRESEREDVVERVDVNRERNSLIGK